MKAKRTLTILNQNDFDAGIQEIIDKAAGVITDHPNGIHATDYDFAILVAEKLALWLNAAREMGVIGGCNGYSNYATFKAAHILANWTTHSENARDAVNLIMEQGTPVADVYSGKWIGQKDRVISRIMSWIKGYFNEISDWHGTQTYTLPGIDQREANHYKDAVSEMYHVGIGCINWRELAEERYEDWIDEHGRL